MNYWLWAIFLVGQILHILKRANMSAFSSITAGSTVKEWLQRHWQDAAIRVFLCSLTFLLWDTPWLTRVIAATGQTWLTGWLPVPDLSPQAAITAGVFGYFGDSILDAVMVRFFPTWVQKEVPAQ